LFGQHKESLMEGPNRIDPEAYLEQMRRRVDEALRRVARAVNDAPDGAWIDDSEMPVFHEFNDLRREAFEAALQMRADAAASAFSPGRPGRPRAPGEQGA
jgi:hypothetical protein